MHDKLQAATSGRPLANGRGRLNWLDGRSGRREYWLWVGPITVVGSLIVLAGIPAGFYVLGLPIFFFWIRRLHDVGLTGWISPVLNMGLGVLAFTFAALLPPVVALVAMLGARIAVIVVLGLLPSDPATNRFGPPPRRKSSGVAEAFD